MKLTDEERKNLEIALMHLRSNHVNEEDGWYSGNLDHFRRRHRLAVKMLEEWIKEPKSVTRRNEHRIDHAGE